MNIDRLKIVEDFLKSKINPDTKAPYTKEVIAKMLLTSRSTLEKNLKEKKGINAYKRLVALLHFKFGFDVNLLGESHHELIESPFNTKLSPVDNILHLQPIRMNDNSEDVVFTNQFRKLQGYINKASKHLRMYLYLRDHCSPDLGYLQQSLGEFYQSIENRMGTIPNLKYTLNLGLPTLLVNNINNDHSENKKFVLAACFPETKNHFVNTLEQFPDRVMINVLEVPPRVYDYFTVDESYIISIDYLKQENGELVPDLILAGKNANDVATNFIKHKKEIDERKRAFQLSLADLRST